MEAHVAQAEASGTAHWCQATCLIAGIIMGAGVLALPGLAAKLGWIVSLGSLVAFALFAFYTAVLISRVHNQFYPEAASLSDLALVTIGPIGRQITHMIFMCMFFSLMTYFLVAATESTSNIANGAGCKVIWSVFVAVALLPPLQLTSLTVISYLAAPSTIAIVLALVITLMAIPHSPDGAAHTSLGVPPTGKSGFESFLSVYGPLSGLVFAYAGQAQFYEMMDSMRTPAQFPRAAGAAYALMTVVYVTAVAVAYGQQGDQVADFLPSSLPHGPLQQFVSVLVLFHTLIAYLIIANSIQVPFYSHLFSSTPLGSGLGARMRWLALSSTLLAAAWLAGNLLPFFSALQGLLGALFITPAFFFYPAFGYLRACIQHQAHISLLDRLGCGVSIGVLFPFFLILGTYSASRNLVDSVSGAPPPFQC